MVEYHEWRFFRICDVTSFFCKHGSCGTWPFRRDISFGTTHRASHPQIKRPFSPPRTRLVRIKRAQVLMVFRECRKRCVRCVLQWLKQAPNTLKTLCFQCRVRPWLLQALVLVGAHWPRPHAAASPHSAAQTAAAVLPG